MVRYPLLGGYRSLKGKLSSSWISYCINYFSCGPDQIPTRHVKAFIAAYSLRVHGPSCTAGMAEGMRQLSHHIHRQEAEGGECGARHSCFFSFGLGPSPQDSDGHTQGGLPALVQL